MNVYYFENFRKIMSTISDITNFLGPSVSERDFGQLAAADLWLKSTWLVMMMNQRVSEKNLRPL